MKPGFIKISKVASDLNITKQTLWNWKYKGEIEFHKIGNLNFIDIETYNKLLGIQASNEQKVVIYCRVSSSVNKSNLQTQKERLISYCNAKGYKVYSIIEEFGSGLNDKRPKLSKLLLSDDYTKIVVEHKDRLCRHGFNYIESLLKTKEKTIEVINNAVDSKDDLMQDFIAVITSYCARLYGSRRCKRKTEKIIEELNSDTESH